MSPPENISGRCDRADDLAAYALGALEPEEASRLGRHLESCAECREELGALQVVADSLAFDSPQVRVPSELRRSVISAVRSESRGAVAAPVRRRPRVSFAAPRAIAGGALAAACAAVIAVVLVSGGSSAARVVQASVTSRGASAVLRVSGGAGQLRVSRMPAPPAGKIYEVWLKRAGEPPAPTDALFGVTASGSAAVSVPGSLRGVQEVLVTPEPLGGSSTPTHAPVIVARLS